MRSIGLMLAVSLLGIPNGAVGAAAVNLKWADLDGMIRGKQVEVMTFDGAIRKGRVRQVEADRLLLERSRTPSVQRAAIAGIRLIEYVGNGRHRGKFAGGVAGLGRNVDGLPAGAVGGSGGHRDSYHSRRYASGAMTGPYAI